MNHKYYSFCRSSNSEKIIFRIVCILFLNLCICACGSQDQRIPKQKKHTKEEIIRKIREEVNTINTSALERMNFIFDSERKLWKQVSIHDLTNRYYFPPVQVYIDQRSCVRKVIFNWGIGDSWGSSHAYYGTNGMLILHLDKRWWGGDGNMSGQSGYAYYLFSGKTIDALFRSTYEDFSGTNSGGDAKRELFRKNGVPKYIPYDPKSKMVVFSHDFQQFHDTVDQIWHNLKIRSMTNLKQTKKYLVHFLVKPGKNALITGQGVNLRESPSRKGRIIRPLDALTRINVLELGPFGEDGKGNKFRWYKVSIFGMTDRLFPGYKTEGWISDAYLEGEDNQGQL